MKNKMLVCFGCLLLISLATVSAEERCTMWNKESYANGWYDTTTGEKVKDMFETNPITGGLTCLDEYNKRNICGIPQLPSTYRGLVTVEGEPAPEGTIVQGRVDNVPYGTADVTEVKERIKYLCPEGKVLYGDSRGSFCVNRCGTSCWNQLTDPEEVVDYEYNFEMSIQKGGCTRDLNNKEINFWVDGAETGVTDTFRAGTGLKGFEIAVISNNEPETTGISGVINVQEGEIYTYEISLSAPMPDNNCEDRMCEVQYGRWVLIGLDGNVVQEGISEEVYGSYNKEVSIEIPDNNDYVLIAVITQFDMNYNFVNKIWDSSEEKVLVKEALILNTEKLTLSEADKPRPSAIATLISNVWQWFMSLFI